MQVPVVQNPLLLTISLALLAVCLSVAIYSRIVQKQAAAQNFALESSEKRHRQLVDSVRAILWQKDSQSGHFTLVNSIAELLLEYPIKAWLSDPNFLKTTRSTTTNPSSPCLPASCPMPA